jgi:predicted DCC family thiol-disulfide oxidoreductase YuxK
MPRVVALGRHNLDIHLLYDADCELCRWCAGVVLACDRRGRLQPVPIGSEKGDELLADLAPRRRSDSWHLVERNGRVHSGGAAFAPLGRALPGGRLLAMLAELSPAATERVYRAVAVRRSGLGRLLPARSRRNADERIRRRADT